MEIMLNTIGCDSNLHSYKIKVMDISYRNNLYTILSSEDKIGIDYDNEDLMFETTDKFMRGICKYVFENKESLGNNTEHEMYHVLIDFEAYVAKYVIMLSDTYAQMEYDNPSVWMIDEEEYMSIMPNIIFHVPVWNTNRDVVKAAVYLNNI